MSTSEPPQSGRVGPTTEQPTLVRKLPKHDDIDTAIVRVDGSYHPEDGISAAGFVIESNRGDVLKESWAECRVANTSMETEAEAALAAIREAKRYNPSFIIVYSDCKPVVERIVKPWDPEQLKPIYRALRSELDPVEFTSVNYIPRERNRRADELAHRGAREIRAARTRAAD